MPPRAREDGLVVQEIGGETLVYDVVRNRASCLSPAASVVWKACDGKTDVAALARRLRGELALEADDAIVETILARLEREKLLVRATRSSPARRPLTRREMLARAGRGSALLVPIVASILAPTAAMAATLITEAQCISNRAYRGRCCTNRRLCRATGTTQHCNGAAC